MPKDRGVEKGLEQGGERSHTAEKHTVPVKNPERVKYHDPWLVFREVRARLKKKKKIGIRRDLRKVVVVTFFFFFKKTLFYYFGDVRL